MPFESAYIMIGYSNFIELHGIIDVEHTKNYRWHLGSSFICIHTGQIETFEELKIATPSVFSSRLMFVGFDKNPGKCSW